MTRSSVVPNKQRRPRVTGTNPRRYRPSIEALEGRAMLSAVPDAIELSFAQRADGTAAIDYAPDKSILNGAGRHNYFRVDVRVDDLRGREANNVELIKVNLYWATGPNESDIINRQKYQETAHETVQINHVHTHPGDIVSLYFDQFNRGQQTPPAQARYLVAVIDPEGYLLKEETNRADNVAAVAISPQSMGMPVSPAGAPTVTVSPVPAAPDPTETAAPGDEDSTDADPATTPAADPVPAPVPTATVPATPVPGPTPPPIPTPPPSDTATVDPVSTEPIPMPVPTPTGPQPESPSLLATIDSMIPADFLNGVAEGVFHGFDALTESLDQGAEQVLESPYFQAAAVGIATGGVGAGAIALGGPLAISTFGGIFLSQGLQGLGVPRPIAGAIGGGLGGLGAISSSALGSLGIHATAGPFTLQPLGVGAIQALSTGSAPVVFQETVPGFVIGGFGGTLADFFFGPRKRH
jgi:hypothetical protein